MKRITVVLIAVFLSSCGSIQRTASVHQPVGKVLLAGPGDIVLRIDRERSLENIAGKADIWGRKTKEGFTEIRFAGVESNGTLVLSRKDVHIVTNETTLTRTPMSFTTASAQTSINGNATRLGTSTHFSGTAQTTGSATTISSGTDYHIPVPSDTVAIRLTPSEKKIPLSGYVIEVLNVSPNSLEFRIVEQ